VSDLVFVNIDRVNNLGREFSALGAELAVRVERLRAETAAARGSYGQTPAASTAESEYQRTARETLAELEQLHRDLRETAAGLADQAKAYAATGRETTLLANSLHRPVP
jgi:hypothetical protein